MLTSQRIFFTTFMMFLRKRTDRQAMIIKFHIIREGTADSLASYDELTFSHNIHIDLYETGTRRGDVCPFCLYKSSHHSRSMVQA